MKGKNTRKNSTQNDIFHLYIVIFIDVIDKAPISST